MSRSFMSMFICTIERPSVLPLAFLFALGLTFVAPALFGSPAAVPVTASVTTYQAAGFQCTIEGYTFEDFTFSDSATGGLLC